MKHRMSCITENKAFKEDKEAKEAREGYVEIKPKQNKCGCGFSFLNKYFHFVFD